MTISRLHRRWFLFKLHHPWARSRRMRAASRRGQERFEQAQEFADTNGVTLGVAIDALFGRPDEHHRKLEEEYPS